MSIPDPETFFAITPIRYKLDHDDRELADDVCITYQFIITDVFLMEFTDGEVIVHRYTDGPPLKDADGVLIEDQPPRPSRVDRYPWPAA